MWGHRLPVAELARAAREDARLSHPNPACADACAAYVLAAGRLVAGAPRDAAIGAALGWADGEGGACEEVRRWLHDAVEGRAPIPFRMEALDDGTPTTDGAIAFVRWGLGRDI